jgi:inorganic pyrophosphatase/exopolyphosphatase
MIMDEINIINSLSKYSSNKIAILGHDFSDTDSIVSGVMLEHILRKEGFNINFYITDKKISAETDEILSKYNFDHYSYIKDLKDIEADYYILVDHHNRKLDKDIILIIDHHPTDMDINSPLVFNTNISSTALYILKGNESYFNKNQIELIFLATMLDTASFNSTKSRNIDKMYLMDKCRKLDIDYDRLYKSGIYITNLDNLKEVSLNGLKRYNYNNHLVESSYIQINDNKDNDNKISEIINILKEYLYDSNLDMFVFIVHDMINLKTRVYKLTNNDITIDYYNQYTSRGTTIMPAIEKNFNK